MNVITRFKKLLKKYGFAGLIWRIIIKPFRILRDFWRRTFHNFHYILQYDRNVPRVPIPEGFSMQHFERIEDIPATLLEQLNNVFGEEAMYRNLIFVKHCGCVFCVGFLYDEPASILHFRKAAHIPHWFIDLRPDDVVFMRVGTVPAHRGKGLAPCMQQATASLLPAERINIYIDVSIHNAPSIRSIEKSGFKLICKKKSITEKWPTEL